MQENHRALLAKLEAFELDAPGASHPFSLRLAKEQGWTLAETGRVMAEYRRFLYLAAAAGHPVSPSEAVDHAWHLHLLYTRSYWQDLCRGVLGFDLHHEPSTGGGTESEKFADWYARTLESYRAHFGEDPPPDLWPTPGTKPASPARLRWVDTARYWLVPKNPFRRKTL